jgi:hypothetical protein
MIRWRQRFSGRAVKPQPSGADQPAVALRRILVLAILTGLVLVLVLVPGAGAAGVLSLPAAGRSLIPPDRSFFVRDRIRERDCSVGKGDTARCVQFNLESVGLSYAARKRLLLRNASRHGWKLIRERDYGNSSAFLYLSRRDLRATLGVGPDSAGSGGRVPTWVKVTRPSTRKSAQLPPVRVDSHATGAAKRRFIGAANAVCVATLARLKRIPQTSPTATVKKYRGELDRAIDSIDRLPPPRGDELAVRQVLTEFRRYSQAIGYLITAKGESSLGAVAAIAVTGKRARKAATTYGLTACVPVFG